MPGLIAAISFFSYFLWRDGYVYATLARYPLSIRRHHDDYFSSKLDMLFYLLSE